MLMKLKNVKRRKRNRNSQNYEIDGFPLSGDQTNNYNLDGKKIVNQHERKIYVT